MSVCLNQTDKLNIKLLKKKIQLSDPGGADARQDALCDPSQEEIISRQLSEQSRFAYAALCGISLGQLFPGPENR